jgi:hypothetical protein
MKWFGLRRGDTYARFDLATNIFPFPQYTIIKDCTIKSKAGGIFTLAIFGPWSDC